MQRALWGAEKIAGVRADIVTEEIKLNSGIHTRKLAAKPARLKPELARRAMGRE